MRRTARTGTPAESQAHALARAGASAQAALAQLHAQQHEALKRNLVNWVQALDDLSHVAGDLARGQARCAQRAEERASAVAASASQAEGPLGLLQLQVLAVGAAMRTMAEVAQEALAAAARVQHAWIAQWPREAERIQQEMLRSFTAPLLQAEHDAAALASDEGRPDLASWWNELVQAQQAALDAMTQANRTTAPGPGAADSSATTRH